MLEYCADHLDMLSEHFYAGRIPWWEPGNKWPWHNNTRVDLNTHVGQVKLAIRHRARHAALADPGLRTWLWVATVAADLIGQAEHDPDAAVALLPGHYGLLCEAGARVHCRRDARAPVRARSERALLRVIARAA